jgi:Flp pilus assembly protein TadG
MRNWRGRGGQATVEFALLYAGVILPLTFMVVFVAEMLWVWHSVTDFTRDGARYAATHCWQSDTSNVLTYMTTHVPRMIDMDQFQNGAAGITVQYFARDPDSGVLTDFTCDAGDCTTNCVPDAVTVSVTTYQFTRFAGFFRLPAVTLPDLHASMAMGGAGCDETGTCLP